MVGFETPLGGGIVNRGRAAVAAVIALFVALYWAGLVQDMGQNERDARDAAARHARFSADAAAEAVAAMLDRFRVSLRIAATAAQQGPEALSRYGEVVAAGADEMVRHLFYVRPDGEVVYTSLGRMAPVNVADRDYFRILAGGADFVVSAPVLGRLSGEWTIQVAHAVRANGRFAGVVAMAVSPRRWVQHLSRFQGGAQDVVSMFSPDGIYLLRTQDPEHSLGQRLPPDRVFLQPGSGDSGLYTGAGRLDGVERAYAWVRLPTGHVVVSGVALEDALAPARRLNRQILLRGLLATAALGGALMLVASFVRRSDRVARGVARQEYLRRVTLSVMAEGLAVVNPDGSIAFHNDSFARLVPYSGERLRRLGSFERWEVMDGDGRPLPLERFPSVVTARTGQAFDNLTLGVGIPGGGVHWLNINTRPLLGDDGKPYAAILTMTDITSQRAAEQALKHSEERYRTLVDSLMEGIVVQNTEGAVVAANPAAERIFGMSHDEMLGRVPDERRWRAVRPDGSPFAPEDWPPLATLRTGRRQEGVVLGLTRPDGVEIWLEVSTAPLWGAGPERPSAVVSSLLDITNRKAFEDELSRSNAELEQFAYAVSHDLREPLRMVASYVQLLQRRLGEQLTDEIREFIGYAADGAKRMDRMLVALLEYSRVGRVGQPMEWMDSRQCLEEALLFLSPAIRQAAAVIEVAGEWPDIFASADEIERLFQNLLGNALKYHEAGIAPHVRAEAAPDGAGWRFSFTDNGIGIAPDQMGRLFKVFQRLHANDRYEGSGVGLALCRKIVQRYEGRIWVESGGPGHGSRFVFTLPPGMVRRAVRGAPEAEAATR